MSTFCNCLIFFITLPLTVLFFRKDGKWDAARGKKAFRFFTVQSNVFCAAAAMLLCFFPSSRLVWLLKYAGTAAVSVTMLTVLFYLGPVYGYKKLLAGSDLFMHLVTPLIAILSFTLLEKRGMGFAEALSAMIPVILYGLLYVYKIKFAPEGKAWEDFYGFDQGGRLFLSLPAMVLGTFLVCMGLMALQSL